MNSSKQYLLHVGLPKAASSFLQHHYFPKLEDVFHCYQRCPEIHNQILRCLFDNSYFIDTADLRRQIDKKILDVDENKVLVSYEGFFGHYLNTFRKNRQITDSLAKIFPNAKVLVIIRKQDEYAESLYKQSLRNLFFETVDDYLMYENGEFTYRYNPISVPPTLVVRALDWRPYIQNYINKFGRENVLILPHELLATDHKSYFGQICKNFGVDQVIPKKNIVENRSFSRRAVQISRLVNRFTRTSYNKCGFIPHRPFFGFLLPRRDRNIFFKILTAISNRIDLTRFLQNVFDRNYDGKEYVIDEPIRAKIFSSTI